MHTFSTYLAALWAFGLAHKAMIITVVSAVAVALVNRHVGGAAFQQFLQVVLDLVSPATQQGMKARLVGTNVAFTSPVKIPLLMRSHAPVVALGAAPPPPKHARLATLAVIAFSVVVALIFGGCSFCTVQANVNTPQCKAESVAACAGKDTAVIVTAILPQVVMALLDNASQGSAAAGHAALDALIADLTANGLSDAAQIVSCSVHIVKNSTETPIAGKAMMAQLSASFDTSKLHDAATAWLSSHSGGAK